MRTESRKIRLEDGSTIDVYLSMNWLVVPIETVATIRAAIDCLMALDVEPTPIAELPPAPARDAEPAEPAADGLHPCGFGDCARTFATVGGRAIHRSKAHSVGKSYDELQRHRAIAELPPAPDTAQDVEEVVDEPAVGPQSFVCQTCLHRADSYAELTDHTRQWHNRFPHRSERHGEEPPVDADELEPAVESGPEEPTAARAYFCDDCDWTSEDGRELFKHTQKAHTRVPHTWERSVRTAAERVA